MFLKPTLTPSTLPDLLGGNKYGKQHLTNVSSGQSVFDADTYSFDAYD